MRHSKKLALASTAILMIWTLQSCRQEVQNTDEPKEQASKNAASDAESGYDAKLVEKLGADDYGLKKQITDN